MKIETNVILLACQVFDKKDKETKEKTGEKMAHIFFLLDDDPSVHLSGEVGETFTDPSVYRGPINFSTFERYEKVKVNMDFSVGANGKKFYKFFDLNHIEKKK